MEIRFLDLESEIARSSVLIDQYYNATASLVTVIPQLLQAAMPEPVWSVASEVTPADVGDILQCGDIPYTAVVKKAEGTFIIWLPISYRGAKVSWDRSESCWYVADIFGVSESDYKIPVRRTTHTFDQIGGGIPGEED